MFQPEYNTPRTSRTLFFLSTRTERYIKVKYPLITKTFSDKININASIERKIWKILRKGPIEIIFFKSRNYFQKSPYVTRLISELKTPGSLTVFYFVAFFWAFTLPLFFRFFVSYKSWYITLSTTTVTVYCSEKKLPVSKQKILL